MWKSLILLLLLGACAKSPSPAGLPLQDLERAWAEELGTLQAASDPASGWPSATDCDGALWAGEARAAGNEAVLINEALSPESRPTRMPDGDCYPIGASNTTSTDMQLGTIVGLLAAGDGAGLRSLQSYTEDHGGIVGSPSSTPTDLAKAYMKPGTRSLLAEAAHFLGEPGAEPWLSLPIPYGPPADDSTVHLTLLSLRTQQVLGTYGTAERFWADWLCERQPSDALAQALCGNQEVAAELILSPAYAVPSYVRGAPAYAAVHRLYVLAILLGKE